MDIISTIYLMAKLSDVEHVLLRNLRSHRDLRGLFHLLLDVLRQNVGQVGVLCVVAHSHFLDGADVRQIVRDDLAHFRKMPAVPRVLAFDI